MKHLAPTFFRAFVCPGGQCTDSCCRAGWEIVPDGKTLALYQTLPGPAGDRVRAGILPPSPAPEGRPQCEDPLLRQDAARVCLLLDPDGLCHVQKSFGHEALCQVCRDYPRFRRAYGDLTEHGLSLSCPTAYALAVREGLQWESWEDTAPIVPHELDPAAYLRLRRGRDLALELLGREDLPLARRIALVHRLAAAVQHAPEQLLQHDYGLRIRRWLRLPEPARRPASQGALPLRFGKGMILQLAERFAALEILSPAWAEDLAQLQARLRRNPARRDTALQRALSEVDRPEPYARYLACSLYKYWLDALEDGRLLARVERSISMTLLGLVMDRAFPARGPFLQRISREIEHSEENLAALLQA